MGVCLRALSTNQNETVGKSLDFSCFSSLLPQQEEGSRAKGGQRLGGQPLKTALGL